MQNKASLFLLLTIIAFTLGIDPGAKAETHYSFGIAPIYNPKVIKEGFQPVMNYLSKSLGVPVRLLISDSHEQLNERLKKSEVDFALLGPVSYVKAKEIYPDLVYLATSQSTKFGQKRAYYFGHIIAHKKSGIKTIEDLENRSFAFVNKHTTSGYNFPMVFFYNNGINPNDYFSKVVFAGTHQKAVNMVARNEVDATTTHDINLWTAEKKFGEIFTTIVKMGPIVNMALVANHNIPSDTRSLLTKALESIPENMAPKSFPYSGFQILSDNSYDNVREVVNFPYDDYYPPDIMQTAMDSGSLNNVLNVLDKLKYDKEKTHRFLTTHFLDTNFKVSGKVAGYLKDIAYNNGWSVLNNGLVLNVGSDRKVYIRIKKNHTQNTINTNLSFKGKIIGVKDLNSIVIDPTYQQATD